jgi:Uma2 family endonuclease
VAAPQLTLGRTRLSRDQYLALPDDIRGEYVDGFLVVAPSPSQVHQRVCSRLAVLLEAALPPGYRAIAGWAWQIGADEYIPDVMVYQDTDESARYTGTPQLAVEVLSGNRSADLVIKATKYAAAGLGRYWVLDPAERALVAFILDGAVYRIEQTVTAATPATLITGVADVVIDLAALLA